MEACKAKHITINLMHDGGLVAGTDVEVRAIKPAQHSVSTVAIGKIHSDLIRQIAIQLISSNGFHHIRSLQNGSLSNNN
jgi:hypothetical protein